MSIFPITSNPKSLLQSLLFRLASLSLFLMSAILTLSSVVRYRSWNVHYHWAHWAAFIIWVAGASVVHRITINKFENWDAIILPVTFLLSGLGIISIWRLNLYYGVRQALWFILCVLIAYYFFKSQTLLETLKKYKYFLLILGMVLAILTFIFGTYPGGEGPNLWLGFHGLYFQPSEVLKLILIIYLAAFFSEKYFLKFNLLQTILPTLILVAAALFILIGQHDLGTALIFIVIYIGMLYIAFGKKRILIIGALIIAVCSSYRLLDDRSDTHPVSSLGGALAESPIRLLPDHPGNHRHRSRWSFRKRHWNWQSRPGAHFTFGFYLCFHR